MSIIKNWERQTICEILERIADPITPKPNILYREIGIRSHGKGIFHKKQILGKKLGNKRVFKIYPDCFIVNIVFAWEQAVARTSSLENAMIASHRFPMYRPISNKCDIDYITYYFKTPYGKFQLESASPGGAGRNKTLGQKEFSKIKLTLPPIAEQRKIAEILSVWDKAINRFDKLIKSLTQKFKWTSNNLIKSMPKEINSKSVKWESNKFFNLFEIVNNKKKQTKSSTYQNKGLYPIVDQSEKIISGYTNCKEKVISDLPVIVFGDHTRNLKWIDFPFSPGADGTQLIKFKKNIDPLYSYYLLKAINLPNLGYSRHFKIIKQHVFYYPSDLALQKTISKSLYAIEIYIKHLRKLRNKLINQKQGLMQQLLTGKIRVNT